MKRLLILLLLTGFHLTVIGQSTIARIKYEQAEEAYNNGNLKEALTKLDETEKMLGSINPKILYLRIMTQKLLLDKGNYSFGLLDSLRKNTGYYIKNYESNTAMEDKFREVFVVYELLTKYPSTKEEYDKTENAKKEREENKKAKKLSEVLKINRFVDSLLNDYKYKPGLSYDQYKKINPEGLSELVREKNNPNYYYRPVKFFGNLYPKGLRYIKQSTYNSNEKIDTLCVITETTKKENEKNLFFQKWDQLIRANVTSEYLVIVSKIDSLGNVVYGKTTTYTINETDEIPTGITVKLITAVNIHYVEITFNNLLFNSKNKRQ